MLRTVLGAYVILEVWYAEYQPVATRLPIEADEARIPTEPALVPSVGESVSVLYAGWIQEKRADDRLT